jgi:hypothetical protein
MNDYNKELCPIIHKENKKTWNFCAYCGEIIC